MSASFGEPPRSRRPRWTRSRGGQGGHHLRLRRGQQRGEHTTYPRSSRRTTRSTTSSAPAPRQPRPAGLLHELRLGLRRDLRPGRERHLDLQLEHSSYAYESGTSMSTPLSPARSRSCGRSFPVRHLPGDDQPGAELGRREARARGKGPDRRPAGPGDALTTAREHPPNALFANRTSSSASIPTPARTTRIRPRRPRRGRRHPERHRRSAIPSGGSGPRRRTPRRDRHERHGGGQI
jgi:hypothetical protein